MIQVPAAFGKLEQNYRQVVLSLKSMKRHSDKGLVIGSTLIYPGKRWPGSFRFQRYYRLMWGDGWKKTSLRRDLGGFGLRWGDIYSTRKPRVLEASQ